MTEPGPNPSQPNPKPREHHLFEEEKIGNDDLMAILGGVPPLKAPAEPPPHMEDLPVQLPPSLMPQGLAPKPVASSEVVPVPAPLAPPEILPVVASAITEPDEMLSDSEPDLPTASMAVHQFPVEPTPLKTAPVAEAPPAPEPVVSETPKAPAAPPPAPPFMKAKVEPPPSLPVSPPEKSMEPTAPSPLKPVVQLPPGLMPPMGGSPMIPIKKETQESGAEKAPIQLPSSLTPPGMIPGGLMPKVSSGGEDPLHLFDGSAPAPKPPTPSAPPMGQPAPVIPPAGLGGVAPSKDDPLHLFDGPVPSPKPSVPTNVGQTPRADAASSDPLHLFDGPPKTMPAPASTPLPLPPLSAFPGKVSTDSPEDALKLPAKKPLVPTQGVPGRPDFQNLDLKDLGVKARSGSVPPALSSRPVSEKTPSAIFQMLEPLARKAKVPVAAFIALGALLVLGIGFYLFTFFQGSSYKLEERLIALHPVRTEVGEVVELDITAFIDIEGKLKQLGFNPLVKLSVSEIPAPNFFAVYLNPSAKTYGIILKRPGSIAPNLSFVSVMTTGLWLSTNAWDSKNKDLEKLSSESAPKEDVAALWARHQKRLEAEVQSGLSSANPSEWRFICALSDHLRWFMALKDIPVYKATFEEWF
jgi:hypothetical protein